MAARGQDEGKHNHTLKGLFALEVLVRIHSEFSNIVRLQSVSELIGNVENRFAHQFENSVAEPLVMSQRETTLLRAFPSRGGKYFKYKYSETVLV